MSGPCRYCGESQEGCDALIGAQMCCRDCRHDPPARPEAPDAVKWPLSVQRARDDRWLLVDSDDVAWASSANHKPLRKFADEIEQLRQRLAEVEALYDEAHNAARLNGAERDRLEEATAALKLDRQDACDLRDGAMATTERMQHERDEARRERDALLADKVRSEGVQRIAAERQRQITAEDWTEAHDDDHVNGELRDAAIAYAQVCDDRAGEHAADLWPWEPAWWKPSDDPVRNLEKAGALVAAEIDRLLRARLASPEAGEREAHEAALAAAVVQRDEARAVAVAAGKEIESLRLGIECLVADEVISSGRARELHGLTILEQREFWRRHPNDLYDADEGPAARHDARERIAAAARATRPRPCSFCGEPLGSETCCTRAPHRCEYAPEGHGRCALSAGHAGSHVAALQRCSNGLCPDLAYLDGDYCSERCKREGEAVARTEEL